MINFKQEELIETLMREIRERFPEVALIKVIESPEGDATLWILTTEAETEDRQLELLEFAANKTTDIHLDYGYHMLVMPTHGMAEQSC